MQGSSLAQFFDFNLLSADAVGRGSYFTLNVKNCNREFYFEPADKKESIVEIFANLADRDSHLCVGSNYMGVGMRRLIVSGRGQVGDGGKKI